MIIFEDTNGEVHLLKKKTMTRRRKIRVSVIFLPDHLSEIFDAELTPSHLQHRTHQSAYHSAQKTIGFDLIDQPRFFFFPGALLDRAKEGFDLGIPLRKRGEIMEFGDEGRSRPELVPIEGIWVEPGAIRHEGILFSVQIIPVFPAKGVVTAVGVGRHGADAFQDDIRGKDGIDVV